MGERENRQEVIQQIVVTAEQMRAIESRVFDAGMPVAALMEKVALALASRIQSLYPQPGRAGVLVGPGHNGGDALVVARELHFLGWEVMVYAPLPKLKELTSQHAKYAASLGIPFYQEVSPLSECDLLIDGLFGFGLERVISEPIASAINEINQWCKPVVSIDLPSGLHTDTGEVLGTAIRATHTFCLGLWKLGLLQERSLEYLGRVELVDFDLPLADIRAVLHSQPPITRITAASALARLPLPRSLDCHKYKNGHLLLVCGSRKYTGAAILSGLGARASGVGMLSLAVPESIKPLLISYLPEALVFGCPETESGAIASLSPDLQLDSYSAIAIGPGLTPLPVAVFESLLECARPLVIDADGLNILSHLGTIPTLQKRPAPTVLTPHVGEFKRLFPDFDLTNNRLHAVRQAAQQTKAVVLLKGARSTLAFPNGAISILPESTPALARGGSGDVLTGLLAGLMAQASNVNYPVEELTKTAVWWHARAGILAAQERTELGVDAFTLTQYLMPALQK